MLLYYVFGNSNFSICSTNIEPDSNTRKSIGTKLKFVKGSARQKEEIELSIEKLDNQIEDYMMKIEGNKKNITSTENEINTTKNRR